MKTAELGQFLLWETRPAKIIGKAYEEQAIIEIIEKKCCQHCGGDLGKEQIHVVVSSPMYQKGAEPIESIKQK